MARRLSGARGQRGTAPPAASAPLRPARSHPALRRAAAGAAGPRSAPPCGGVWAPGSSPAAARAERSGAELLGAAAGPRGRGAGTGEGPGAGSGARSGAMSLPIPPTATAAADLPPGPGPGPDPDPGAELPPGAELGQGSAAPPAAEEEEGEGEEEEEEEEGEKEREKEKLPPLPAASSAAAGVGRGSAGACSAPRSGRAPPAAPLSCRARGGFHSSFLKIPSAPGSGDITEL